MNEIVNEYIESMIPDRTDLFQEMERFAEANNVPIMELAGIEALLQILRIQKPKRILEIGTAIGYSALRMAHALPEASIVTIERDPERFQAAKEYITRIGYSDRVIVLEGDALDLAACTNTMGPFDAIFIDAAKGQYTKFFEMYSEQLADAGCVYTDNVLFKGLVAEKEIENKRIRNLVAKIKRYNEWLMTHPDYLTSIMPVGDGLAVSIRRGEENENA
ncbi:O-methyltransferase [Falsibacillus pallidus]|uniref:tRNA 5-hydroxyuridine methyltransferase n=1 Tax=Falsibacillus pallidus TaxID=493781 RepID=A0A370GNR6_9BACI|nr:O-methyltransferase [Falsibacillus pallidus]RDI44084.1 putative O-methyltransferase YrrM [Falsibacillus pallidus]